MKGRACPPCRVERCDRCSDRETCGCEREGHDQAEFAQAQVDVDDAVVRRSVVVDFEGVIATGISASSSSGILAGDPVPGAYDGLVDLITAGFEVAVITTWQPKAVSEWLFRRLGLQMAVIPGIPALAHLSAKAVPFESWGPAVFQLRALRAEAEREGEGRSELAASLAEVRDLLVQAAQKGELVDVTMVEKITALVDKV